MRTQLIDNRQNALISEAKVRLIIGAPGVGKTYFGCHLADYEIHTARIIREPYQKILFLTFARNAVARIRQVYNQQTSANNSGISELVIKNQDEHIRVDTFAGFFWWLVESYGRFVVGGSPLRPWFIGSRRIGGEYIPQGEIGRAS